jgi:serine/threonine-protein kinase
VLLNQHLEVTPPSPRKVNPRLSLSQEQAVFQALAKAPKARYRTASELLDALLASETLLSSMVKTPSRLLSPASTQRQRVRRALFIGAIVILVVTVVLIAISVSGPGLQPVEPSATATATASATITPTELPPTATPTATLPPTVTLAPAPSPTP